MSQDALSKAHSRPLNGVKGSPLVLVRRGFEDFKVGQVAYTQ